LAEELDGGVRNLVKYTKLYSYSEPTFNDGLVFTAFVGGFSAMASVSSDTMEPHDYI